MRRGGILQTPSSGYVKNQWSHISAPSICLYGMEGANLILCGDDDDDDNYSLSRVAPE